MYICLCKAITDTQIREAVANGATQFGQIDDDTKQPNQNKVDRRTITGEGGQIEANQRPAS